MMYAGMSVAWIGAIIVETIYRKASIAHAKSASRVTRRVITVLKNAQARAACYGWASAASTCCAAARSVSSARALFEMMSCWARWMIWSTWKYFGDGGAAREIPKLDHRSR